jgi:hypothetical protein
VKQVRKIYKSLLLFVFLTAFFNTDLHADDKPLVREIIVNKKDSVFRHTFYFDEFRNKVMENKYFVENNTIYPIKRTEWVYESNRCVSQREQTWQNGNWITTHLNSKHFTDGLIMRETLTSFSNNIETTEKTIISTYDNGFLTSVTNYRGEKEDNDIMQQLVFSYNDVHKVKRQQIINGHSQQTDSTQILQYVYDSSGKLDSVILINRIQEQEFKELLTTYFYDRLSGNLIKQIQKEWNEPGSKWENLTKTEFVYDSNNRLVSELYAHFNILFWTPNTKYEYVYNADGLLEQKIMYQAIYRQWRKIFTIEYSDISNGQPNLMESKYNFWGGETGSFVNNYIPYYFNDEIAIMNADRMEIRYFIDTTVITNSVFETGWLKIYPNPSNGVFYISTQDYYIETWEVYNLSGVMVKNNVSSYRTGVVDLTDLADGIYMINARTSDNKQLKQKIVINKSR